MSLNQDAQIMARFGLMSAVESTGVQRVRDMEAQRRKAAHAQSHRKVVGRPEYKGQTPPASQAVSRPAED